MKVCIIGNNLSALLLSKVLVNKVIKVDLCYELNKKKTNFKRNYSRTIGLSNSSIDFLKKENKSCCYQKIITYLIIII